MAAPAATRVPTGGPVKVNTPPGTVSVPDAGIVEGPAVAPGAVVEVDVAPPEVPAVASGRVEAW